jgi:hypothetical protein
VPVARLTLPQDAATLQQMVLDLLAELEAQQARLKKTEHLLQQLLAARRGPKSEQISPEQLALFAADLEAQGVVLPEIEAQDPAGDDENPPTAGAEASSTPKPHGRRAFSEKLERQWIVHDLAEEEKHCATCGQDLRPIGEETSQRYEYIPARVKVIEDPSAL